jgi:hypothetical protein
MKLIHNTPIKRRYSLGLLRKRTKTESEMIQIKRETKRRKETTESPETTYCLWFLSLKLLLEMEELKLGLQKPKTDKKFIIGKDIKIDKKFYKDWDLDDVSNQPFHKWWKTHKELFEPPTTVEIDNLNGWTPKPHFRFLRVDTRNNYTSIMKDIRSGLENLKNRENIEKKSQYPVYGQPRYDNEIVNYNILVRKLNGEDNFNVFESEKSRLKIIEKTHKGRYFYEKKGLDGKVKVLSESKLWGSYREYMKLTPKEREIQYAKVRKEDVFEREEGIYRTRRLKTEGLRIGSEFRSALTLEINRYMKDYQQILNGVAQGIYREQIEF